MQGDKIDVNGKTYMWDERTRDYVRWVTINSRPVLVPMTNEEAAQAVRLGVENLIRKPRKLPTHAKKEEIVEEMLLEEMRWRIRLKEVGRVILDDVKRAEHYEIRDARNLHTCYRANSSLDFIKGGVLVQRNFYDEFGKLEQEIDYFHQDSNGRHIFPHIHVWILNNRSNPIAYRRGEKIVYLKMENAMRNEEKIKGKLPDFMAAGFAFDRRRAEWRKKNGIDDSYMDKFNTDDLEGAISTIKDVQALMSFNWEFSIKYKDCEAHVCTIANQFYFDSVCNGKEYEFVTDNLDDFENATVGPYKLKDIVDKWTITEFI